MAAMTALVGIVRIHDNRILPSMDHSTCLHPNEARATKVTAPIWQCVVDTGCSWIVLITTDSVEPNSMHEAVWKSTDAILEPTVWITRQPSVHTPRSTKKPPTAMIQTGVSGCEHESSRFWYVPRVAEKAAVALAVSFAPWAKDSSAAVKTSK